MDAHTRKSNIRYWLGIALVALFASVLTADAKCTIRSGDPLIKARYQDCNPRSFISYLYNDLITPYSFKCAKQLKATCQNEKCEHPTTEAEARRCLDRFSEVLTSCGQQIDDAARMAKCTDTKAWPVDRILAQFVAAMPTSAVASTATAPTTTAAPAAATPQFMPVAKASIHKPASVKASSLPRSNGPMTAAEKEEMAAAMAADDEATVIRATAPAVSAPPVTTMTATTPPTSVLDTSSMPATPTVVPETPERAPATTTDAATSGNAAPASPSVKAEPLPGETFEVARKPARTSRAPRNRFFRTN